MSEYFEVNGDSLERKYKNCNLHDGQLGYKMAEHSDRWTCGFCGYTEFKK
tara:strand:- start:1349 stop:1498 length:150 start_codon:yes stop_codon:yes gene_type:complete